MTKRQRMWLTLTPRTAVIGLAMLTGSGSAFAQTSTTAEVVTDSVNVPVQVRTALRGIPVVNTQQILHKSSLEPEESSTSGETASVRLLNNLDLNTVGLRMDLTATSWAKTPGATSSSPAPTPTPTPTPTSTSTSSTATATSSKSSTSSTRSSLSSSTSSSSNTNALAHAALEGTSEAVVRLGPANTEVVSVSGRGLASAAEITGACGSLESTSQVSLGTTNLRVLGREVTLPENPAPNTEVALSDIPGLVSGTVVLNEQATFGDGVTTKVVAVAPLRLILRLSLAGLGGLADVEVSLAGNSASVDCGPEDETEPPTETPGGTPTTPPTTPTTPGTPTTPTSPTTPASPTTPTTPATPTSPYPSSQPSSASTPPASSASSPTPPSR